MIGRKESNTMTTIKIISGVYGHRPEKSPYVVPVTINDPPISVEDDEAIRLVELGVAAYVEAETPPPAVATAHGCDSDSCPIDPSPKDGGGENGDSAPGDITGNLAPEALKEWKMDDLKKLAVDMGLDISGIRKKDDLIQAIAAVEVTVPSDAPVLGVEDVIE